MNGYQLTFFTQQNDHLRGQSLAEWLLTAARDLKIKGATLINAAEGYGRGGHLHAAHFFELAEQPQAIIMAVTTEESKQLFEVLEIESVRIFYVKTPVEFGVTGSA
ncbi:MAG TPA: DUF190 domain-containing protein [Rhodocyclaceae bacterium]|jgi:PII-like signaling protein|nr:DUF190 domain-containing protein [Rhodocyclaceae bacterium]